MALKKKDIKIGDVVVQSNGDLGYITKITGGYFDYYIPAKDITVWTSLNNVNCHPKQYKRIGNNIIYDGTKTD